MAADQRDIVAATEAGRDGDPVEPWEPIAGDPDAEPESDQEAQQQGDDDAAARFWERQIKAGLLHERRWRAEAEECERLYFGPDEDPGAGGAVEPGEQGNRITDKTALIHGTVDVLKPLLYSESPSPVVRRRYRGDGDAADETALMASEVAQRLAEFLIDDGGFDDAMERVRDDWLIAGRGAARAIYKATVTDLDLTPEQDGVPEPVTVPVKSDEQVCARAQDWRRVLFAPALSWEVMPWIAFEVPMTRRQIEERFGAEVAAEISYTQQGLADQSRAPGDEERDASIADTEVETDDIPPSPFDTVKVWEIWVRESEEVVWWSPAYRGILDRQPDPLGLEGFYPMPRPLTASVKGGALTPRPDIKYYERRAKEIDLASMKLKTVLDALSISGMFPAGMEEDVKGLLKGENRMIPVSSWIKLMEKGGTAGVIQWLPLEAMIQAANALVQMREQAKQAMFEASGVSDVMRAQGDPNETATAQQIKGRYAGLRMRGRQRQMAIYARDMLRIMLEIAVEHFDTDIIAEITGLDLPMTEMERQMMVQQQQATRVQYQRLAQQHQAIAQAVEQGLMQGPVPPAPEPPKEERIPATSFEAVHQRLRDDWRRKITVTIETESTVLADEQADKEARIEFITALTNMVKQIAPLAGAGQIEMKALKEIMLFGVRGFPQARTLESIISDMPDEPDQSEQPPDPSVQVAQIKAQADKLLKEMEMSDAEAQREHDMAVERLKVGADMIEKSAEMASDALDAAPPAPPGQQQPDPQQQ